MLEGKYVRLVVLAERHLDDIVKSWNNPKLRKYLGGYIPATRAQEVEWIENVHRQMKERTAFGFAIERISDHSFLGSTAVHSIEWVARTARVGIAIFDPENWGKGYGSETLEILIDFSWKHLNLRRLELGVHTFNKRAIRVYEKLGFKMIGTARQKFYIDGEYVDEHYMEIFRDSE
jgi:RimJ/RimL family protein N-acetyltransferase